MDQKPKLMTPFDMLVTSSSLYTLKLMLKKKLEDVQTEKNQMEERKRTQENLNEYKRMLRMRQG